MENKQLNQDVKIGLKSFLTICGILIGVIIFVGVLTFVIPAGSYQLDSDGNVIVDSFSLMENATRLPVSVGCWPTMDTNTCRLVSNFCSTGLCVVTSLR